MANDDFSSKLNEILSSPEGMEKIRNLASMLSGGGNETQHEEPDRDSSPAPDFDPSMILNMKKAMDLMGGNDPRVDLLLALKPNLSDPRRKKVDEAIHLMRLIKLMPLLREQGLLWGDG